MVDLLLCLPTNPCTLQSASNTPPTTGTGTPTTTQTATLSTGAQPSGSPVSTPTASITGSNTPSISVTPSNTPTTSVTASQTPSAVVVPAWLGYTFGQSYGIQQTYAWTVSPYQVRGAEERLSINTGRKGGVEYL